MNYYKIILFRAKNRQKFISQRMRNSSAVQTQKHYSALHSETIQIEHELHQKRLQQVKAQMKIERPVTPAHLIFKRKAELRKKVEQDEIQRENGILYAKMAYMKPNKYHPNNLQKAPSHGTLNLKKRIQEMNRIDIENEKIKNKLVGQRTHYPSQNFERAAIEQERIKRNMLYNSNRYERNNFFVGVDPRNLNSSQQRIFYVESPYTNQIMNTSTISTRGGAVRPKTASSHRSKGSRIGTHNLSTLEAMANSASNNFYSQQQQPIMGGGTYDLQCRPALGCLNPSQYSGNQNCQAQGQRPKSAGKYNV